MLAIKGKPLFDAATAAWLLNVKKGLERAVTKMMFDAQTYALQQSPVYTGDYASNWNVSYGKPDVTFIGTPKGYESLKAGPLSSSAGLLPGKFNMEGFQLGQTAYLTNAAEHDEPYAWLIEGGKVKFREVNTGKDRVGGKTFDHLSTGYSTITRGHMV